MTNKFGKNGRKQLTHRQRAMIKALVKGKSQAQAYREAGYSPKNADQGAYQVLQSIKKKIPEIMDENGLTDEALIGKHLASLLNATEVKAFNHKGKVIYSKPLKALDINMQALREAFKLKGSYAPPPESAQAYAGVQFLSGSLSSVATEYLGAFCTQPDSTKTNAITLRPARRRSCGSRSAAPGTRAPLPKTSPDS